MTGRMGLIAMMFLAVSVGAAAQQPSTVTGTAMYRERMMLPPNAVFEATLEDVSRVDAPATVLERYSKEKPGAPPFQFSIAYDPTKINEQHTYVVRTKVMVDGKLMFTSTERQQVLTHGHGSEIGAPIVMRRVASAKAPARTPAASQTSQDDVPLQETYWKLVELEGKPVTGAEQQREASLIFHKKDNRVTGSGGCNRLSGGYVVAEHTLHFKGVASTMMACLHGMDTEQAFVAVLNKVESWKVKGSSLELFGKDEALLARFDAIALR